jgi:hypothetical protein
MALPLALDSVRVFRPEPANGAQLSAWVQALDHGEQFNACVVDEAGKIYVELRGYRTVTLTGTASLDAERRPL